MLSITTVKKYSRQLLMGTENADIQSDAWDGPTVRRQRVLT